MVDQLDPSTHPLKAIADKFDSNDRLRPALSGNDPDVRPGESELHHPSGPPPLSAQHIQSPALLLNNEMRILWQNGAAKSRLWYWSKTTDKDSDAPQIFDLLFDPPFQSKIANWRQWAEFFIHTAQSWIAADDLRHIIAARDEEERQVLQTMVSDAVSQPAKYAISRQLRQIHRDGVVTAFAVVGTFFDQGLLLVFEPASGDIPAQTLANAVDLDQRMEMIRRQPNPVKLKFYTLAARLNDAETLRTEMLDEECSRLLQRIWKIAVETVEHFSGIVCQYTGDGLIAFFLPDSDGKSKPMSVIQCALELKTRMAELGREWKIRKGWLHNVELNMGIHAGTEYLFTVRSAVSESLMPMGHTLQLAGCLSSLAVDGQVWTTKELINQVPPDELRHIRFGVFRDDGNRQVFIARCFSRIRDLTGIADIPFDGSGDLGAQAVTQIFDRSG